MTILETVDSDLKPNMVVIKGPAYFIVNAITAHKLSVSKIEGNFLTQPFKDASVFFLNSLSPHKVYGTSLINLTIEPV